LCLTGRSATDCFKAAVALFRLHLGFVATLGLSAALGAIIKLAF
jgi:hypothetical protein